MNMFRAPSWLDRFSRLWDNLPQIGLRDPFRFTASGAPLTEPDTAVELKGTTV